MGGYVPAFYGVIVGSNVLAQLTGWLLESSPKFRCYFLGMGIALQAVGSFLIAFELVDNSASADDVVAAGLYAFSFATFPLTFVRSLRLKRTHDEIDTSFVVLSVTSKLTLLAAVWALASSAPLGLLGALYVPSFIAMCFY